jgi:hypothetical protein
MGYIKHHSIIVTGSPESILDAREKCINIFAHELIEDFDNPEQIISSICLGLSNSQHSFFIAPDGSKEGWETSNNCDNAREVFLQWLKENNSCEYIEVYFGGDSDQNYISKCSDND